jgi:hypothetical protein
MSEETPTAGWFTASAIFLTPVGLLRKRRLPICQGIPDDRRRVASDLHADISRRAVRSGLLPLLCAAKDEVGRLAIVC